MHEKDLNKLACTNHGIVVFLWFTSQLARNLFFFLSIAYNQPDTICSLHETYLDFFLLIQHSQHVIHIIHLTG